MTMRIEMGGSKRQKSTTHRKAISSTHRQLPMYHIHSTAARRKAQRNRAGAARSIDHFALAWLFGNSILEVFSTCGNWVRACDNCKHPHVRKSRMLPRDSNEILGRLFIIIE